MKKEYVVVPLSKDEYLSKKIKHKESYGKFSMMRRLNTMGKSKSINLDIVDLMNILPKGASSLFTEMKKNMDPYTNITHITKDGYTPSQKTAFSRNLSELKKYNMVKKAVTIDKRHPIEKDSYMVDPELFIPINREEAIAMWKLL